MASTRNKNTPDDYCLQQRSYGSSLQHNMYEHSYAGKPYETAIPCLGITPSYMSRDTLSNNAVDIESALKGINSVNLDDIRISYYDKNLIFKDNTYSNFPIKALSINCTTEDKEKDYFFAGNMKIKWHNSCKELKFTDYKNNSKKLIIKNNISINYD